MAIGSWREGGGPRRRRKAKRKDPFEDHPWFKMKKEDVETLKNHVEQLQTAVKNIPGPPKGPFGSVMDQWSSTMNAHRQQAKVK